MNSLSQFMIFWAAISVLGFFVSLWIAYAVLKAAIRDGINESRLPDALKYRASPATSPVAQRPAEGLPPMRAEK